MRKNLKLKKRRLLPRYSLFSKNKTHGRTQQKTIINGRANETQSQATAEIRWRVCREKAEVAALDCPNCGAGRAKHEGVTHCAYCGFQFIEKRWTKEFL